MCAGRRYGLTNRWRGAFATQAALASQNSDSALKLVFLNWRLSAVSWTALGIGGAIVGHVGSENWSLNYTFLLMAAMVTLSVISKCMSFSFVLYRKQVPKLQALPLCSSNGAPYKYLLAETSLPRHSCIISRRSLPECPQWAHLPFAFSIRLRQ